MHHPTTWLQACLFALDPETILQDTTLKATFLTRPRPGAILSPMQTL
jgi:hypothetical protein